MGHRTLNVRSDVRTLTERKRKRNNLVPKYCLPSAGLKYMPHLFGGYFIYERTICPPISHCPQQAFRRCLRCMKECNTVAKVEGPQTWLAACSVFTIGKKRAVCFHRSCTFVARYSWRKNYLGILVEKLGLGGLKSFLLQA